MNIGGGVPCTYDEGDEDGEIMRHRFLCYTEMLRASCPELLTGADDDDDGEHSSTSAGYEIITECGRSIVQKAGWVATTVEYVKRAGGRAIAVTHAGAHIFLRTAYLPKVCLCSCIATKVYCY